MEKFWMQETEWKMKERKEKCRNNKQKEKWMKETVEKRNETIINA